MKIKFLKTKKVTGLLCNTFFVSAFFLTSFACQENGEETLEAALAENQLIKTSKTLTSNDVIVSSNGDDGNVAENTIDGKLDTRWSSNGLGKYITYDLKETKKIDEIRIAWYKGDQRKAYFQVAVGDSKYTLNTILNKKQEGSSGTTEGFESYELPDTDARYLRIRGFGNSESEWNSISEVQIVTLGSGGSDGSDDGNNGDNGDNGDTDGGTDENPDSPAALLGGLKNWKLNAYSGTLSIGDTYNGLTYVDNMPNLENHSNKNWFYTDGTWTYFKAHVGNPTSSGSGNPRSELRELTKDGSDNIYWDGTTSKEHRMIWKVKVDRLPQSGKVCFGQIHDKTDKFDDVIRVQCQGSGGQTSGKVSMRINGYVTEVLEGGGKTVGEFNLGEELYLELTYKSSIVKLYELDSNGNRVRTIFTSKKAAAKENYFKAGAYLQSVKGKKAKDINDFGLVGIKEVKVFH